jgi:hypothetical protein
MIRFFTFILAAQLCSASAAWAWPLTFGAEFEFTNSELKPGTGGMLGGKERDAALQMLEAVRTLCAQQGGCRIRTIPGKFGLDYRVRFKDGWWFQISYDPACVEVQTRPSTLEELRALRDRIQTFIFGAAKSAGLHAALPGSGGHVNVGARSAFDDVDQFLAFFVDYANHPELGMGITGKDHWNAPPIVALGQDQRDQLKAILAERKQGMHGTIREAASAIISRVYTRTLNKDWPGYHHQAIGLKKLAAVAFLFEDLPFEFRAVRGQGSLDDFLLLGELVTARLRYLRETKDAVVFLDGPSGSLGAQEIIDRFYVYVTETGEPWEKYESLARNIAQLPPAAFLRGKVDWSSWKWRGELARSIPLVATSPLVRMRFIEALSNPHAPGWQETRVAIVSVAALAGGETLPLLARRMIEATLLETLSRPTWSRNPRKLGSALHAIGQEWPVLAKRLSAMLAAGPIPPELALAEDATPPAAPAMPPAPLKTRCRMALRNSWDLVRYGWGRVVAF